MFRLWRREANRQAVESQPDQILPEGRLIEDISQLIKTLRKKEELYYRVYQNSINSSFDQGARLALLNREYIALRQQEDNSLLNIEKFKEQSFYQSKRYLYTIYMRVNQILEINIQKVKSVLLIKNKLQDSKIIIYDYYQGLLHRKQYDMAELLREVMRKQNERIMQLLSKKVPLLMTKKISSKKSKTLQSGSKFISQNSLQALKKLKLDATKEVLRNKKKAKESLETQRRQKDKKERAKIWDMCYGILNVKKVKVEDSMGFRVQMEQNLKNRNQSIKSDIQEWNRNRRDKGRLPLTN